MKRTPSYSVCIFRRTVCSDVSIKVAGKYVAVTTMGLNITEDSPQVLAFVRRYFHLPDPVQLVRTRKKK